MDPLDPDDTLFNLRYAERVLERYARLWRRLDVLLRVVAFVAGSGAFAALVAEHREASLWLGVLFALAQAIEFVVAPPRREQEALAARAVYARVRAEATELEPPALHAAYLRAVAADTVVVPDTLRELAYNDVIAEQGLDPRGEHAFSVSPLRRGAMLFA